VWIVDDSPLEGEISRRALAAAYDVRVFQEATALLEQLAPGPRPDALVVDWTMPNMSGLELCRFVRRSLDASTLPVVILTATLRRDDLLQALAAGANDYVTKPFDPEELAARVATAVQTKRLNSTLESAAEFRERFIGIVGHDLRQPLSTLRLGTTTLLRRELSERDARTVRLLSNATHRMEHMIADLLDLTRSRLGGGIPIERKSIDFVEACREIVEEIQVTNADCAISLRASGDGRGEWDRGRIQQICTNLIGNALEHGAPNAPIAVTIGSESDGAVSLSVENTGAPIPLDLRASLFDPFRGGGAGGSSAGSGLGLGLFIVSEIAAAHGGSISVESDEARTVFSVRLPRR
jgi:signal transduction histidine kinase